MYNDGYHKESHLRKVQAINRLSDDTDDSEVYDIVKKHLKKGNRKLPKSTLIFNLNSGRSCPNAGTNRCQVPVEKCYARKAEQTYPDAEPYRDRQELLWDALTAEQFADAVVKFVENRISVNITAFRFNESGDIRSQADLEKMEKVASLVNQKLDINFYTYSCSSFADFNITDSLVVNASNEKVAESACGRFNVVESESDIPDDAFVCPGDCGSCSACEYAGEKFELLRE